RPRAHRSPVSVQIAHHCGFAQEPAPGMRHASPLARWLESTNRSSERGDTVIFVYLVMALLGVAAAVFAVENPDPVTLRFLMWRTASLPLSVIILLAAFVGVVSASVSGFAQQIELRRKIRRLEHRIVRLSEPGTLALQMHRLEHPVHRLEEPAK